MPRRLRYVIADVFTDEALAGNPLAVFTDARGLDSITMQRLARELNLSETVFVLPPQAEGADVRIRIFTPAAELQFAGHPTLGSAFVLGGALQAFGTAAYGRRREEPVDGASLDRALDDALAAVGRLRVGAMWPMRTVHSVARSVFGA